jgi:beta-glucosidase
MSTYDSSKTRRDFIAQSLAALTLAGASIKEATAIVPEAQKKLTSFDKRVAPLLAQMSLEEKVGQMSQPDQSFLKSIDDIETYHFGSLLSGGDSDPKSGNDLMSWTEVYDSLQTRALKVKPRIPLLYGIDAVHGNNNVIGATLFPQNVGLGCTRDARLVEKASAITAEEVRAIGVNWAFAPCVTVPQDIRWGRTYEGYSESPDVVKILGEAAVRGLQNGGLNNPLAVLGCAKHYVGDGATSFGTGKPKGAGSHFPLDQGDSQIDEATLRKICLPGYITCLHAGVGSIMPSYSSWNGVKCSASKKLLTDLLKTELGFEGFLISDYAALNDLPGSYKEQIATSINAGMDMVMIPQHYQEFVTLLLENVKAGTVPQSRIDDAVTRILRVKFAMGMMDPKRPQLADRNLHKSFGSPEHRAVAREAVRKSLVLVQNNNKALPLKKSVGHIHVAGKSADDLGNQCGGWTIQWQGKSGSQVPGTTVLAAVKKAVSSATKVTTSVDGSGAAGANVGIVVIGETPYAEMMGDRTDLRIAPEDVAAVEAVKSAGIPVVVVLFSGRPMVIDAILGKADAIVAAWLPGSEGEGITDVLFGDNKPTGKLSFTWPSGDSTSFHIGDPGYKTLYKFGYGLGY